MQIGIIGRSGWTYSTMQTLFEKGHEIKFIITSKGAPEYEYQSEDFQQFAKENGIIFLHEPKINSIQIREILKEVGEVDLVISINYSGIIEDNVINCFRLGVLNAHGGDLPKYRGNACQAWALLNEESKIGLCIHKMIGGELDSGPIIARSYLDINTNTRISDVYKWMDVEIPVLMSEAVERLYKDSSYILEHQSTDKRDSLRCYPRLPEDGLIDWSDSAPNILRLINASSEPYSGAYSFLDGKKVVIWKAVIHEDSEVWCGIPGQVAQITDDEGVVILTSVGKIKLLEISFENEVIVKPAKLIKSIRKRFRNK